MNLPTTLKLAIVATGRTQKEIALEVGVHPTHMSRIVNGLRCDEGTRERIAAAVGRGVGELWPGHEGALNHTPDAPGTSSEGLAA